MRGQRGHLEDRPDGEVDENYWAQAAADQAAGRAEEDIDQSKLTLHFANILSLTDTQPKAAESFLSAPSSSRTTMTILLDSTTWMIVEIFVMTLKRNRNC